VHRRQSIPTIPCARARCRPRPARSLPSGYLDPVGCGILADALEQRGAPADFLEHLRAPAPHVRGCHVVDWVLRR
jgi:hypothetical protein